MRIDIPTVTPEVLEAVANMYNVAAKVMREGNDPYYEARKSHAETMSGRAGVLRSIAPGNASEAAQPKPAETEDPDGLDGRLSGQQIERSIPSSEGGTLSDIPAAAPQDTPTSFVERAQQTATVVNMPQGAELDAGGFMWDKDVHTRTKSKDKNGLWKPKGGRAAVPVIADPDPLILGGPLAQQAVAPVNGAEVPTAAGMPAPAFVPDPTLPQDVGKFVMWVSQNSISTPQVMQVLADAGLSGIAALDGKPELIAQVCRGLKA